MKTIKTESYVEVEDGYKVWTQSIGGGAPYERPPLLVLHGGPGMGHDYLDNLEALASDRQKIVFYDQLGCGRSDAPDDPNRWKFPRFIAEIESVRKSLGLDKVVIYGQSWGGMLAIEYFLTQPKGVIGGILSNALSSAPEFSDEIQRLVSALTLKKSSTLEQAAQGEVDQASHDQEILFNFYSQHVLRLQPFPKHILEKMVATNQVYEVMWGKNEFTVTGNLKDWDRSKELSAIKLPIQIISGEFDESTPKVNEVLHRGLIDSTWVMMPGCSHLPNFENPNEYFAIIQNFLDRLNH